jgi:hypothetical protein
MTLKDTPGIDEEEIIPKEISEEKPPEPPTNPEPDAETEAWIAGKETRLGSGQPSDVRLVGDAQDAQKLETAMQVLENSDSGRAIAQSIRERGTQIGFAPLSDRTVAQFNPPNGITVNEAYKNESPAVLAAALAHEGTHLQSGDPSSSADALDQEYKCFKTEAEVWNQVKGGENNLLEEDVVTMIGKGEAEAKAEIWQTYGEEYFTRWDKR